MNFETSHKTIIYGQLFGKLYGYYCLPFILICLRYSPCKSLSFSNMFPLLCSVESSSCQNNLHHRTGDIFSCNLWLRVGGIWLVCVAYFISDSIHWDRSGGAGAVTCLGGFFFSSSRRTSTAFSRVGSLPLASSSGRSTTSISG